jgi:DNA helicase II / ATP-dependent DNA helicase PcrA
MLNAPQLQAVSLQSGPLLMLAWAWAGKTHTLTERVARLIEDGGVVPDRILCVTFTNKAAKEMRERIAARLSRDITNLHPYRLQNFPLIGTFHSLWVYFLRAYGSAIGFPSNFTILDEDDKIKIIKNCIETAWFDTKEFPPKTFAAAFSSAKNMGESATGFLIHPKTYADRAKQQVYQSYITVCRERNTLDFDDILLQFLALLEHPESWEVLRNRFDHIHVDEYQDTNDVQYKIVKNIASRTRNLAVVGDDWQGIYSWRGANIHNILSFESDYPDATVIKLEENYRSTQSIIQAANAVIKHNKTARDKTLWTQNEAGDKIQLIIASDDKRESEWVAKEIAQNISEGLSPSQWCVLYRTNAQSRAIEEALIHKNIPYKVYGGLRFYERKEIKDILAYLRFILNQTDYLALERAIGVPNRKVGDKTVQVLVELLQQTSFSQLEDEHFAQLPGVWRQGCRNFFDAVTGAIAASFALNISELLPKLIEILAYDQYLLGEYDQDDAESRMENIAELISFATKYSGIDPRESLAIFLEDISLLSEASTQSEGAEVVSLMTVHTSKGLEYHSVAVIGLEDGLFPSSRTFLDPKDLEEERRLMYVAMTRAKKRLFLLRAKERMMFWQFQSFPGSRFLAEIPESCLQEESYGSMNLSSFATSPGQSFSFSMKGASLPSILKKPSILRSNAVGDFSSWCKVEHMQFGIGTIISLSGEIADIAFPGKGIKKLNVRLAPITVVHP